MLLNEDQISQVCQRQIFLVEKELRVLNRMARLPLSYRKKMEKNTSKNSARARGHSSAIAYCAYILEDNSNSALISCVQPHASILTPCKRGSFRVFDLSPVVFILWRITKRLLGACASMHQSMNAPCTFNVQTFELVWL